MENEKRRALINHIEKHIRHNEGRENCGFEWDKNNAEVYRIALAALNSEQQRSLEHHEFLLLSADQVQREYAEALGCAGDNESILEAIDDMKKRIAELEERTPTVKMPEPFKLAKSSSGLTYYYADEVDKALAAASINVEAE
ncbi:hypothetical protein [Citrobacter koseri]